MQRFEEIYAEHLPAVRAYVARRAPEAVVDDVVSDTFVVCLRKIERVPEDPLPWLYAVAKKTLANERRRRARVTPGQVMPAVEDPAPIGDGILAEAFNSLIERDREVLRLVAWEGLSLADAATVLGCSALACRVRYHRAKSRLASKLATAASIQPVPKGATR